MNRNRHPLAPLLARAAAAAILSTLSHAACGQAPMFHLSLTLTEVHAGTTTPVAVPDGLIEPGEGVLFELESLRFEPDVHLVEAIAGIRRLRNGNAMVGTVVHTPLGSGPVLGLAALRARLTSSGGGAGTWSNIYVDPEWYGGQMPFPQLGGADLAAIFLAQYPPPLGTIRPTNPIEDSMQAVWTPSSYAPRTVEWSLTPNFSPWGSLYIHYGNDPTTGQPLYTTIPITTSPIGAQHFIHVVPAPGALPLIAFAGLAPLRRRDRVSDRRRMHASEIPPLVFIVIVVMVCAAMARADEAMIRLKATYPGIKVHEIDGRPAYIYGRPMSGGETSEEAVQNFLAEHGGAFIRQDPVIVSHQYPHAPTGSPPTCNAVAYDAGQVLSGVWTRIRNSFVSEYGHQAGLERVRQLHIDWMHLTSGGDNGCNAAHPGTVVELLNIASMADVGFICSAFASHQVPDPSGDCP